MLRRRRQRARAARVSLRRRGAVSDPRSCCEAGARSASVGGRSWDLSTSRRAGGALGDPGPERRRQDHAPFARRRSAPAVAGACRVLGARLGTDRRPRAPPSDRSREPPCRGPAASVDHGARGRAGRARGAPSRPGGRTSARPTGPPPPRRWPTSAASGLAERKIGTFSLGERGAGPDRARDAVARPELLLFDEPAAGLDLPARERLLRAMQAAHRGRGRRPRS